MMRATLSRMPMSLRGRTRLTARAALVGAALASTAPLLARAQQPANPSGAPEGMLGAWQGLLASGAFRQRLGFIVSRDSTGALVGLMKSLDQGAQAPASVAVRGDTFSFTIATEHITYSGVITGASRDSVRGTFAQNG